MMRREKDKGQVDRPAADLHPDGVGQISDSSLSVGVCGQGRGEPESGDSLTLRLLCNHAVCDSLDARIHPFSAIFCEFLVVAPHVGVVVVQLSQQVMQFRGVFCLERPYHPCLQELAKGVSFFNGRQKAKTATDLIFVHADLPVKTRVRIASRPIKMQAPDAVISRWWRG